MNDDKDIPKSQIIGKKPQIYQNSIPQTSFGKKTSKKSLPEIDFKHVSIALKSLSNGEDIERNLEIIKPRIGKIPNDSLNELVPIIPYPLLWDIIINHLQTNSATTALILICYTAECEDFPIDFFVDDEKIEFLLGTFKNGIPLSSFIRSKDEEDNSTNKLKDIVKINEYYFREMCYYIFDLIVQGESSFKERIISERLILVMNDNKLPKSGIMLLYHMLASEPLMEPKTNMQIEMIFSLILSDGLIESISLILDLLSQNELPEIEGFSITNFPEIIMTKTIRTNDPNLLKKIFSIIEQLSLSYDDVSPIFLEKLQEIMSLFINKKGDPKQIHKYKNYIIWAITQYVNQWMKDMQPENVLAGVQCFIGMFDSCDFSMQSRIVKCFTLLDNSVIQDKKIIDGLCKFISSEQFGVNCIAKLHSILITPSHPLFDYTLEQCCEFEDEIDELLCSTDEKISANATLLCETIEKLKN